MRTQISVATFLLAGSGVTGAWGSLSAPYYGSDALLNVTRTAIDNTRTGTNAVVTDSAIGPNSAFVGGAGDGQGAMAAGGDVASNATQQTAAMSRMINSDNRVCFFNNDSTGTGANLTNASGIVIGLDAVSVLSNIQSGAQDTSACNGGSGLAHSGTTGVFSGGTQNWKWILALIYGGRDYSQGGVVDCNSSARQDLANNWMKLFQGEACTPSGTVQPASGLSASAVCGTGTTQNGALWHAFRPGDGSGAADVFASILGLSPSPSSSALHGFGTSPFCNALNWDTQANNANCAFGGHDQWTGPGGVVDRNSACNIQTGVCGVPGSGNHRRPPPPYYGYAFFPNGIWGDNPDPNQSTNSADVLPTQFQDNDPLRRPCLGNGSTGVHTRAGEEVCNLDLALGLVLPIVDSDWIPAMSGNRQYPTNHCTNAGTIAGKGPSVMTCAIRGFGTRHVGECPNGDQLNGGVCVFPDDGTNNTTQCIADSAVIVAVPIRQNLGHSYGRAFNMFLYDGSTANVPTPGYLQYPLAGNAFRDTSVDFTGAFYRIHQVETVLADATSACQMADPMDQIGCLVAEDPCSIGFASHGSVSWSQRPNGFSFSNEGGTDPTGTWDVGSLAVSGIGPNIGMVQALGRTGEYQLASKLYFSTLIGFGNVVGTAGDPGAFGELALAENEANPTFMDAILTPFGFFPLGSQNSAAGSNNPFCEDFNEHTICGAASNSNACLRNPAMLPVGTGATLCGNGVVDAFEECDGTVKAGTGGCSNTCRCVLDYNSATGQCN